MHYVLSLWICLKIKFVHIVNFYKTIKLKKKWNSAFELAIPRTNEADIAMCYYLLEGNTILASTDDGEVAETSGDEIDNPPDSTDQT